MINENLFPPLPARELRPTLNTLQAYARFLGAVRRAMTPRQKHWYHVSLRVAVNGLTTTSIPAGTITFEMALDLISHKVVITTSRGEQWQRPLRGQSPFRFCEEGLATLAGMGIEPEIDRNLFSDTAAGDYDPQLAQRYLHALAQIDVVLKQFKGELRAETSPVQLWPHHFDLAMLWLSGRLVPGVDPADEEYADEQMNFGFAPGDDMMPGPYFYVTAYPTPDGLTDVALPTDATWHTDSFTGAILPYDALVGESDPDSKLLDFFRSVQRDGAALMR